MTVSIGRVSSFIRLCRLAVGWGLTAALALTGLSAQVDTRVQRHDDFNRIVTTFHGDTTSRRAFSWYSPVESTQPLVLLSTTPTLASTVRVNATTHTNGSGERFFRAVATGLRPGTTYYYQLGFADHPARSATGSFVTSDGTSSFTLIALTDTQSSTLPEAEQSAAVLAQSLRVVPAAAFVLHHGDVVEHGDREQEWTDLLSASQDSLLTTTLAPAAGERDQAPNAFADHFALDAPNGQSTTSGIYYSFDYNAAHVIVLNTNESPAQGISASQLAWLASDAKAARARGAKWLILSMHKGPYTPADHMDDAEVAAMRGVLVPLIDALDIDLVLQGHDHILSRTRVLASDPRGIAGARVVETARFTEMVNGKRIEYAVDPHGTIYFLPNTAGATHYTQKAVSSAGIDLEAYFGLFDRLPDAAAPRQTFAAIRVTDDRLTVEQYDIRGGSSPRLFEGFGIDRRLPQVERLLAALPGPGEVALGDAGTVAAARRAVHGLTPGQRGALQHLTRLEDVERQMRRLQGLVSDDGAVLAWADRGATSRQAITVRNDTRAGFSDVPVRVTLAAPAGVTARQVSLFALDGVPLPFEIETWTPGRVSTIWVKVPVLPARAATVIWAYYGGDAPGNDPSAVWSNGYSLVDHMSVATPAGGQRPDSTGRALGRLRGQALAPVTVAGGVAETRFDGARIEFPGNIGGDYDTITVSGLYRRSAADAARSAGTAPVIAKESATGDGPMAFVQATGAGDTLAVALAGNSFQFPNIEDRRQLPLVADGRTHLVTQTYDGMTYSVFIDGREVYSTMIEYRTTFSDPNVLTTIGDRYTSNGAPSSPFHGHIDEVHITGTAFTPEYEAFRYANFFGDAVTPGQRVERSAERVSLTIGTPRQGAAIEAGLVEVTGSVNRRSVLAARVGQRQVFQQQVDAGLFAVKVPVHPAGAPHVVFHAVAVDDAGNAAVPVSVPLAVSDTKAPAAPLMSHASARPASTGMTLSVTPRTDDLEPLDVRFYANARIELSSANVDVRVGTSTGRLPDGVTPASGRPADELWPTTVGDNANPFQIYAISLTPGQAALDQFHLTWRGTADTRRVSAWVWDHQSETWRLKASGFSASGEAVSLDVTALASEHAVRDGTLRVLVWRGLTSLPWGAERDYSRLPESGDYEWSFDHVGDTQLYSQATPARFVEQMEYVASAAGTRKTALMVQVGDLVNREYYSQEYQWAGAEQAMRVIEKARLPYLIAWGNHDYSDLRNGRVMLPRHFPMHRLESSLAGSPWHFGGSHDIANYYYTGEISGARLLVLTLGYFSVDNPGDAAIEWAQRVIRTHPDHAVIFATHNAVGAGTNTWSNPVVVSQLVEPHDNVRLVLGGHIAGTGIASHVNASGRRAYGVLTDYQSRVYGGQQFLKHVSVDAENGFLYFNTYSPMLDRTESDGRWHQAVDQASVPGFHGADSENYVLELDLGGRTTRTLATAALTLSAGSARQVGETQGVTGAETARVIYDPPARAAPYEWYAELTDASGHVTRSDTRMITRDR
jgi:hypothetical protein